MRMTRGVLALAGAAVLLGGITPATASTFLKVDVPTLRGMSEAVVQAKVVDVQSAWNAEGTAVFTHVTLEVTGRLHGSADEQIVVRVPGGTVGGFTSVMEGAPVFQVGDHVVAFVARWHDGVPMVAGYAQGLSRVKSDKLGNLMLEGGVADGMHLPELGRQLSRAGN
jgi:hypothetical protein